MLGSRHNTCDFCCLRDLLCPCQLRIDFLAGLFDEDEAGNSINIIMILQLMGTAKARMVIMNIRTGEVIKKKVLLTQNNKNPNPSR